MRNKTAWVILFFAVSTFAVGLVLDYALTDLLSAFRMENKALLGPRFTLSTLVGMSLSIIIASVCAFWYTPARQFVEQALLEMWKVHWPTLPETQKATWTVIATSCVAAVILGFFDMFFGWFTATLLLLR